MSESKSLEERDRLLGYLEAAHSAPSGIRNLKGKEVVIQITKGTYMSEESSVVVPHTDFLTVVVDKVDLRLGDDHLEIRFLTSPFDIFLGSTHRVLTLSGEVTVTDRLQSLYIHSIIEINTTTKIMEGEVPTSIRTSIAAQAAQGDTSLTFFVDGEILDGNCKPYLFSQYTKRYESAWEDNRGYLRDS